MGIFQQFPYTNFHEMNLDQIIKLVQQLGDDWKTYKEYFDNFDITAEVLEALNTMLEAGLLGFVVPEMFGAKGDGTTDDTAAMQAAADSGKLIYLINDYKCGHITAEYLQIYGNGKTITNAAKDTLFECTDSFTGSDFTIVNPGEFDYLASFAVYGTIQAKNIIADSIRIVNINSAGFKLNGNCDITNCIFDNTNFDVKTIYDGSSDNHSFGMYIDRGEDCVHISVKACEFYSLIEGVYYGTTNGIGDKTNVMISDNLFNVMGDHAAYINSREDDTNTVISHNICIKNATAFCTVGNDVLVSNNMLIGAYDGIRSLFGCAIRDGGRVVYRNNTFISGTFTTWSGSDCNFIITSLVDVTERDQIIIEDNYFDINDQSTTATYFRIGAGLNANFKNIYIRNNRMSILGGKYGIISNVSGTLTLEGNKIYFNQSSGFLTLGTTQAVVKNNFIQNENSNAIFHISSYGIYHDNTFNCNALPLRRAATTLFDIKGNVNVQNIGVYNMINTDQTNLIHQCNEKGSVTVPVSGTVNIVNPNINAAFRNTLLLYDTSGNAVAFTITNIQTITMTISAAAGTYNYVLL